MNVSSIPIVAVSYNAPDLIETLLLSLQQFYSNPIYIIDGSVDEVAPDIEAITPRYPDVQFHGFGYNIHHGPGITWAVHHLNLSGPVLFLDSDVEVVKPGMIDPACSPARVTSATCSALSPAMAESQASRTHRRKSVAT